MIRAQIKTLFLSDADYKFFISEDKNCDRCKIEITQLHADSMIDHCEITCLDYGLIWNSIDRLNHKKSRNDSLGDVN